MRELETGYDLLSVALSEGLQMRAAGNLWAARSAANLCADVAERHGDLLCGALLTMERRSRHFGVLPEVHPLDPETFRTEEARSSCFWNALLHRVLFSARSRWFHKVTTLQEVLGNVQLTFHRTAREIADGVSVSPFADWDTLECVHDDWNTCLKETTVLLKCLLTTLSPGEVEDLRRELEEQRKRKHKRSSDWLGLQEEKASQRAGRSRL
ncbi:MAG TPA: hypothetical protein VKG84_07245 [Candidatus Acidoferrales bacterium]|nr:hypothetical protein [Candidatus Acidoferrales bacterium]